MRGGVTGTAAIVTAQQEVVRDAEDSDSNWWDDAASARFGKTHWLLELDVHVADGAPYRVSDRFGMPNRLHKVGRFLDGPPRLGPGVVLPVVVAGSDPQKVEIDWKAFEAAGGMDQLYAVGDQYRRDAVREILSNDPVQRAAAVATIEDFLGEVKAGRMAREDFVGYVDEYLAQGLLSAEEGSSAKDRAAEPSP